MLKVKIRRNDDFQVDVSPAVVVIVVLLTLATIAAIIIKLGPTILNWLR